MLCDIYYQLYPISWYMYLVYWATHQYRQWDIPSIPQQTWGPDLRDLRRIRKGNLHCYKWHIQNILQYRHHKIEARLWIIWENVEIRKLMFSLVMMTSSNGSIFRLTGPLCGEFTGEFPWQRPAMRSFDVFFDLRLNKRLSKQPRGWWFETPSCSLWRNCNGENIQWEFSRNYRLRCYCPISLFHPISHWGWTKMAAILQRVYSVSFLIKKKPQKTNIYNFFLSIFIFSEITTSH